MSAEYDQPTSTPPEIPHNVTSNVFGAGGRQGKEKRYGDDVDLVFVDEVASPGDTSNESINAFNKRSDVPVTEVKTIDRDDIPGPPLDGPDGITSNDRIPRRKGNPDWIGKQYVERARETDGTLSKTVLAAKQDPFRTDD